MSQTSNSYMIRVIPQLLHRSGTQDCMINILKSPQPTYPVTKIWSAVVPQSLDPKLRSLSVIIILTVSLVMCAFLEDDFQSIESPHEQDYLGSTFFMYGQIQPYTVYTESPTEYSEPNLSIPVIVALTLLSLIRHGLHILTPYCPKYVVSPKVVPRTPRDRAH